MKLHLVGIDLQNDFVLPSGGLSVPGAEDDATRFAEFIRRNIRKIDDIHLTLDSHNLLDYRHPGAWRDQNGKQPSPITLGGAPITEDDIKTGIWTPIHADARPGVLGGKSVREFMAQCAKHRDEQTGGAVPGLEIWPVHAVIATPGHNIYPELMEAVQQWEIERKGQVDFCVKGTNTFTEHYGALEANDPLATDPSTGLNTEFLDVLKKADFVAIGGEAASHCVMTTVNQIADNIGEDGTKKLVLFKDCMSPVPNVVDGDGNVLVDFEAMTQSWYKDMEARGVTITTSTEFMA